MENKPHTWETPFENTLASLAENHLLRGLTSTDSGANTSIIQNGKKMLSFGGNNYLGLASHPKLMAASIDAIQTWGVGAGASRLISGNSRLYETLETEIARLKLCEAAVVFPSGYTANVGTLSTLIGEGDLVLFDRLNHASLLDGVRLSKGKLRVYRHKDIKQLESLLFKRPANQKAWIVTDGIFSMDGDIAPLPEIVSLAKQYDAVVYLDDAHATGVLGKEGRGTSEYFSIHSDRIIQMGTFSKALGSFGGFIAGSNTLIQYLINKARSLIYTTALPPAVLAASYAALQLIQEEEGVALRKKLWANTDQLRHALTDLGFDIGDSATPIIPLRVNDTNLALTFSNLLFEAGIAIPAIRPPTVPKGQSRLRMTVMATHTQAEIAYLIQTLKEIGCLSKII